MIKTQKRNGNYVNRLTLSLNFFSCISKWCHRVYELFNENSKKHTRSHTLWSFEGERKKKTIHMMCDKHTDEKHFETVVLKHFNHRVVRARDKWRWFKISSVTKAPNGCICINLPNGESPLRSDERKMNHGISIIEKCYTCFWNRNGGRVRAWTNVIHFCVNSSRRKIDFRQIFLIRTTRLYPFHSIPFRFDHHLEIIFTVLIAFVCFVHSLVRSTGIPCAKIKISH